MKKEKEKGKSRNRGKFVNEHAAQRAALSVGCNATSTNKRNQIYYLVIIFGGSSFNLESRSSSDTSEVFSLLLSSSDFSVGSRAKILLVGKRRKRVFFFRAFSEKYFKNLTLEPFGFMLGSIPLCDSNGVGTLLSTSGFLERLFCTLTRCE